MSTDMFIKIGSLKGESAVDGHKDEIQVLAWSWGLTNDGTSHIGSGSGSGKVSVQDLTITKYVDKSSPDLILAGCNGRHFQEAKLTVRKAGEKPLDYLVLTLSDVMITAVSTGGAPGQERLTENVTLNFAKVKVDYKEQLASGGAGVSPTITWDIRANKAA